MISAAQERIKELESQLLETQIAAEGYRAQRDSVRVERDQLAARCERLCGFVSYRKGKMPIECHREACELLDEQPATSLARHDAELLRRLVSRVVPRIDAGGPNPIDPDEHCCEYSLYIDRERIHNEFNTIINELSVEQNHD